MAIITYKSGKTVELLTIYVSHDVSDALRAHGINRSKIAENAFKAEVERIEKEKMKRRTEISQSLPRGAVFDSSTAAE